MNEKQRLLKIPVKERTKEQHLRLAKLFGGVRNYLLSMGKFKEDKDEFREIFKEKIKLIEDGRKE